MSASTRRRASGAIFRTLETAGHVIGRAKTAAGLRVTVGLLEKVYETGRTCAEGFKADMKIVFDDRLPKWNDRALPRTV